MKKINYIYNELQKIYTYYYKQFHNFKIDQDTTIDDLIDEMSSFYDELDNSNCISMELITEIELEYSNKKVTKKAFKEFKNFFIENFKTITTILNNYNALLTFSDYE